MNDHRPARPASPAAGAAAPSSPGSPWRAVAVWTAVALACAGVVSADRAGAPRVLGAAAGATAALLGVLALPSLPTRRIVLGLLVFGGLAIARHAALPGVDVTMIVLWGVSTLVALLLVDRAQSDVTPTLPASAPLASRAREAVRGASVLAVAVVVGIVAFAPTLADAVWRDVPQGDGPSFDDLRSSPSSLRTGERLDMTSRPRLSDAVVFTVESDRPDFWRGETWDEWDGQGWQRSQRSDQALTRQGEDVDVPASPDAHPAASGTTMRQTFRMEAGYSNIVFAAPTPIELTTRQLVFGRDDGTMAVVRGFARGESYTVVSRRAPATEASLRAADALDPPNDVVARYAQAPTSSDRVRALAAEITAAAPTTYDKIRAIEAWLSRHTRYSLDAPLSPPGEDVVDHFVFESRLGWCEQVASTLTVMLRSVGVPARVATGFVTGDRDALTGRYTVREKDAHAWTEVYFPGVGWQGFDPTASVPLAGEAASVRSWIERARAALPAAIALVAIGGAIVLAAAALRRRVGRPARPRPVWSATMLRRLERLGRRADVEYRPGLTVREYARALAVRLGEPQLDSLGALVDADAFSSTGVPAPARTEAERDLGRIEAAVRERKSRWRRPRVVPSIDQQASKPTVKGIP